MRPVVVLPHRSRRALLRLALRSVRGLPAVVVDDSNGGGLDPAALRRVHPEVRVVRTEGGVGFARAVNAGLAAAEAGGARLALLLNDDAVLAAGAVRALLAAWGDGAGAVGPLLVGPGGLEAGIRVGLAGRIRTLRRPPPGPPPVPVDALSGACLLLRASERLDPRFPHGMEDVELCLRLRRRGLAVRLEPRARCRHLEGATVPRRSPEARRAALAGHLLLSGGGLRDAVALGLAAGQALREGAGPRGWAALARGWRDGRRLRRGGGAAPG